MQQLLQKLQFYVLIMKSRTAQTMKIVLIIFATYGLLFGPIAVVVGTFSGPHILIPGLIHIVIGLICLVVVI